MNFAILVFIKPTDIKWCRRDIKRRHGVLVITTAKLHSSVSQLGLCIGTNPARAVSCLRWRESPNAFH